MKPIKITDGCVITKTRKNADQYCVACGGLMGSHVVGVMFNNYSHHQVAQMKKNLWLHVGCTEKFGKTIGRAVKKHSAQMVMEGL